MSTREKANKVAVESDRAAIARIDALMSDIQHHGREIGANGDDYRAAKRVAQLLRDRISRTVTG